MTEGTIKRRRRAPPEPIAEGERRNITFLADARTYNFLVDVSRKTGKSISDLLDQHLNKNLPARLVPKFEDVFFGTPATMEMMKNYAMIFSACARGRDWRTDESARACIVAAIRALNEGLMPFDETKVGDDADTSDPVISELKASWGAGRQIGELLAGPLKAVVEEPFDAQRAED
jgi:hypothetical protein